MDERAFWVVAPGQGEIRTMPPRPPSAGDVVVCTLASGISRGTEALVFQGRVPQSQYEEMRCPFQDGAFPGPVKYGYASVGVRDDDVRVFCLHPHQDRYRVPADATVPVPDDVPDRRAVLAANMETAVNALWDAGPRVGDRIAVVGGGVVGCLFAALAGQIPGTRVELVDINPARAAIARRLGVGFASPDTAARDADIVVHASGVSAGLATALDLAGFEALVLELSWYGNTLVPAPLGEAFHSRRLTLRSSQVGAVATSRRARRSHRDRMTLALDLLRNPIFDCVVNGESRFEDLPSTMKRLAADPGETLCHVVLYN
ncbi:MAG: dehydrogenase [Alphaproteobacteria bacterium]|nr:dehydrogenase [Alphaproteobacteria bacterium]